MEGEHDEPVLAVLRPRVRDLWRSTWGYLVAVLVVGGFYTVGAIRQHDVFVLGAVLPVAVPLLIDLVRRARTRVVLTDREAILSVGRREQRLAASDIHGLQRLKNGTVIIWATDRIGRDVRVGLSSPDGREAVDVIGQWWLDHRGAEWQPHWAPALVRRYDAAPGSSLAAQPYSPLAAG